MVNGMDGWMDTWANCFIIVFMKFYIKIILTYLMLPEIIANNLLKLQEACILHHYQPLPQTSSNLSLPGSISVQLEPKQPGTKTASSPDQCSSSIHLLSPTVVNRMDNSTIMHTIAAAVCVAKKFYSWLSSAIVLMKYLILEVAFKATIIRSSWESFLTWSATGFFHFILNK